MGVETRRLDITRRPLYRPLEFPVNLHRRLCYCSETTSACYSALTMLRIIKLNLLFDSGISSPPHPFRNIDLHSQFPGQPKKEKIPHSDLQDELSSYQSALLNNILVCEIPKRGKCSELIMSGCN